jgi:CRP/FNR family transcriptional regulator, anaerobic regulatory protein
MRDFWFRVSQTWIGEKTVKHDRHREVACHLWKPEQRQIAIKSIKSSCYTLLPSVHFAFTTIVETVSRRTPHNFFLRETQMNTPDAQSNAKSVHPAVILAATRKADSLEETHTMRTALEEILALGSSRIVTEGTAIHRSGDAFRSIYFLKSGAAKRSMIQEDGREQVLGFPMPGELFGIEAIDSRTHTTTVVTLDMCAIIEVPFDCIEHLAMNNAKVAHFLFRTLSCALREEHGWLAALGLLNADERLAAFLLDLSQRFASRGFSARRFMLRMTRAEIGSFLGLTLETVSRVFSRFQKLGLLKVTRRDIELLDLVALAGLAQIRNTMH